MRVGSTEIVAVLGDLTAQDTAVVVNAANEELAHGGGVAAALVRAGGRVVQDESDRWVREHGPVASGAAAVTSAGAMPAEHVVHVVGPRYRAGQDNAVMLSAAVTAALDAAERLGARTISFPAISAGIFGYPLQEATAVLAATVVGWVEGHAVAMDEIRLVGHEPEIVAAFEGGLGA
jgi:O-acetyl-ADP-ribose deacetylase